MKQVLLIMRLVIILLTAGILHVSAATYAQKINIQARNETLEKFLKTVKQQSGYDFVCDQKILKDADKVTINLKDATVEQALNTTLDPLHLTYTVSDKLIVIEKKTIIQQIKEAIANINVSGRVVDEQEQPLVGATIQIKNGSNSTTTDGNGIFTLKNVDPSATIVISFIGYEKKELPATPDFINNIILKPTTNPLDEVKIVAYGQTTDRLSVGNIASVSAKTIGQQPVVDPLLTLEGRIPGLQITQQTGFAGSAVTVKVQGQNSISAGTDPFYVIDGVPYSGQMLPNLGYMFGHGNGSSLNGQASMNPLSFINPDDIESISVLKDASATSIYGSRAANGAIIITTKKGKQGRATVSFNVQQGVGSDPWRVKLLNTQQYLQVRRWELANDGITPDNSYFYSDLNGDWDTTRYTDWQKKLLGGKAKYADYNASISGGTSNIQYLVGTTYHRETTVFPGNSADGKGSVHFNLSGSSDNQKFKFSFGGSYQLDRNTLPQVDLTGSATTLPPDAPPMYTSSGAVTGENPNSAEVSVKPVASNVSYWPFDEGTGTSATDIWNGRKGILNTAVTWVPGQFNSSVHSDATANSYTTLPANIVSTLTDFTISAWVKQDVAGVWGRVFDFGSGTTNYMFLSPKGTTGFPRYAITTGSGEQGINGTAAIPTGTWTHMAVTQAGSVAILYVNGVEVGRNTAMTLTPSSMGNTAQNYIGKSQWSGDPILNGAIDDFRIYSRALTSAEINVIKNLSAQTITFNVLAQQTVGNADVDPGATASSGLPASYLSGDTTIAKIVDGKIHAKGAGTVIITAIQAGNGSIAGSGKSQGLTVLGPPPVPVLSATSADGLVSLSWNSSTGATSYNLKRSTVSGGPFTPIKSINAATYTDSTVVNGTSYFYVVSSVNSLGESANSAQVKALPAISPNSSYWPFNETSGATATDVWNGRVAAINTGATFVAGYTNNALHLDGTANGYANLSPGAVSGLSDFTIATRVKMDAISTWMRVFDLGTGTTNYMFLTVQAALASGKSTVRYAIKNGGTELNVSYAYTFPLNTWVSIAITQSGNTASLYINGSLVATNTNITIKPSNLGNTTLNYLGKSQFADPMFKGSIDDFRIINRALSASEIARLQNAANQTITFNAIPLKHAGDADFDPAANSTSGLNIKYISSDTTVATILTGKVHIKAVGTAVITASQTGNNSFNAALPVSQTLTITKVDQTITFATIPAKHVGDADLDPAATSTSGLPVIYSSSDTSVATIVSGKIHIRSAGTSVVSAVQQGNMNYNPAATVTQLLTVTKYDQTISFTAVPTKHVGDDDLDTLARASSGLPVVYTSSDTAVAKIVNGKVHVLSAGTSTITALQSGNSRFNAAASLTQLLTVVKYDQAITFTAPAAKYVGDPDLDSLATASSGLAVSYSSSDTTVASVWNGKIHIKGAGSSVITASQTGNAKYAPASPVDQTLTVNKKAQTITFNVLAQQHVGASDLDPLAIATSGLPITYVSSDTTIASVINSKLHIKTSGTAVITASQSGNSSFASATPVDQSLTVVKNDQAITFNAFTPKNVNDTDFVTGASVNSGLPLAYSTSDSSVAVIINGKVHITGAGSTNITASQNGNFAYSPASPVTQSLTVNKLNQQITFNSLPAKRPGDADLLLTATANTGLPVTYSSSNVNVATIVSGKIHVMGVGNAIITASQAGNSTYKPATAAQTFNVLPYNLQVQSLDGDNGQVTNNVARPYFRVANLDSVSVAYNQLTIRYWFTAENYAGINTWIDYAQLGNSNISMNYVALSQPRNGALGYIEYKVLANGLIAPNSNSGPIQSRFANQDWSLLNEADDYSFQSNTANYVANPHMTLYRNGSLIWGSEPANANAAVSLSLTYQNQNQNTNGNSISTFLSVNNSGNVPVSYSDITARYWLTEDGTQSLNFYKDYVKMGSGNVNGTFTKLNVPKDQADNYLELSFNSGAGTLYPLSGSGNIQYRISKTDWSAFNEANDFSYAAKAAPAGNNHITLYYKGQLIYGTEPGAAQMSLMFWNDKPKTTEDILIQPEIKAPVMFPNPLSSGNFSIKLTKELINKPLTVRVVNPDGRLIMTKQFGSDNGDLIQLNLPASGLPGVYQVKINDLPGMKLLVVR